MSQLDLAIADLDEDGLAAPARRSTVAAASGESAGALATWHGPADGSFRAAGRYEIAAADLTGDGPGPCRGQELKAHRRHAHPAGHARRSVLITLGPR